MAKGVNPLRVQWILQGWGVRRGKGRACHKKGWWVEYGRKTGPWTQEVMILRSPSPALDVPSPEMLFLLLFDLLLQMKQSSPGEVICPKPCNHWMGMENQSRELQLLPWPLHHVMQPLTCVGLYFIRLSAPWGLGLHLTLLNPPHVWHYLDRTWWAHNCPGWFPRVKKARACHGVDS